MGVALCCVFRIGVGCKLVQVNLEIDSLLNQRVNHVISELPQNFMNPPMHALFCAVHVLLLTDDSAVFSDQVLDYLDTVVLVLHNPLHLLHAGFFWQSLRGWLLALERHSNSVTNIFVAYRQRNSSGFPVATRHHLDK
ncbi:MAG: hypothetical protein KA212_01830 [Burkholderiaceae bacterium]|nr:hypothetical protein [Burkholderiaceae bacterium]